MRALFGVQELASTQKFKGVIVGELLRTGCGCKACLDLEGNDLEWCPSNLVCVCVSKSSYVSLSNKENHIRNVL